MCFNDISTLGQEYAYCVKSDAEVEVPGCELFAAGFSCKDVSGMNKNAAQYEMCAETGAGTTGKTLHGALGYVDRHRPPIVFLENVVKLGFASSRGAPQTSGFIDLKSPKVKANLRHVVKALEARGYKVAVAIVDSSEYFLPQRRVRIFIHGIWVPKFPWSKLLINGSVHYEQIMNHAMQLQKQKEPLPLATFDLKPGTAEYAKWVEQQGADDDEGSLDDEKPLLSVFGKPKAKPKRRSAKAKAAPKKKFLAPKHRVSKKSGGQPAAQPRDKYKEMHQKHFSKYGLPWPVVSFDDDDDGFFVKEGREKEVLHFCKRMAGRKHYEDGTCLVVDSSQSITRCPLGVNMTPCLCPRSKMILLKKTEQGSWKISARLAAPSHLHLQGLAPEDCPAMNEFSAAQLRDLAGNAFCGLAFSMAITCVLVAYEVPPYHYWRTGKSEAPPAGSHLSVSSSDSEVSVGARYREGINMQDHEADSMNSETDQDDLNFVFHDKPQSAAKEDSESDSSDDDHEVNPSGF